MVSPTRTIDALVAHRHFQKKGIALIMVMVALTLMTIMALQVRIYWQRDHIRELEQELLFRGQQYVQALSAYNQANNNIPPDKLDVLYEKKFIRQLYPDPMTQSGEWNLVMAPGTPGQTKLLVIPAIKLSQYLSSARLVGVCSTSTDEAMLEYREKQRYSEWAFFVGDDPQKKMPDLEYVVDEK